MGKSLRKPDLNLVRSGVFRLDPHIQVSALSRVGDETWEFNDGASKRLDSVPASRLRIDWSTYASDDVAPDDDDNGDHTNAILPPTIIMELRAVGYLYLHAPTIFFSRTSKGIKPQTMVITVRALARFFSTIYKNSLVKGLTTGRNFSHIQSIGDITLTDMQRALAESTASGGERLRNGLTIVASPVMKHYLVGPPPSWGKLDVKNLKFRFGQKRDDYNPVMPNGLFRLLSDSACWDVLSFIRFLGKEPEDKAQRPAPAELFNSIPNGAEVFDDYVAIRNQDRKYWFRSGKRSPNTKTKRNAFRLKYGMTVAKFQEKLYRVQRASYTIIGLYTGGRYSDLTTFRCGCIEKHHGQFIIKGTEVKSGSLLAPEDNDLWPAIPIMRDAITCLEQISQFTFNPYFISSSMTVAIGETPAPLSLVGFTSALNTYLEEIDTAGFWEKWQINAHQLRHSLAHQLARADVGLLYIAHQMKHLHTAFNALPPNVTLLYGNISDLTAQKALLADSAYNEAAYGLYDPDRPVAGGGAQAFKKRRKAYFEGMAAQGWTKDEVIANLARQGMPFASVGLGYCGGKRKMILEDGTEEVPPCLGSLQCNPVACSQALITDTHIPQWKKVLKQNREMARDERMAHAKDVFLAAATTAERVLQDLQVPLSSF